MSNAPAGRGQQAPPFENARNFLNVLMLVCRVWATSLEVFLHRGMGDRFLGLPAMAVLLLVPVYFMAWPGYDLRPLIWFLHAYLVMCLVTRVGVLARRWRGGQCHSFYTGSPRILGANAKISEVKVKQFIEPALVLSIGLLVRERVDVPLGTYLMIGAGCLCLSVYVSEMTERVRAQDMSDAVIEQQLVAERFREMRGGD